MLTFLSLPSPECFPFLLLLLYQCLCGKNPLGQIQIRNPVPKFIRIQQNLLEIKSLCKQILVGTQCIRVLDDPLERRVQPLH